VPVHGHDDDFYRSHHSYRHLASILQTIALLKEGAVESLLKIPTMTLSLTPCALSLWHISAGKECTGPPTVDKCASVEWQGFVYKREYWGKNGPASKSGPPGLCRGWVDSGQSNWACMLMATRNAVVFFRAKVFVKGFIQSLAMP